VADDFSADGQLAQAIPALSRVNLSARWRTPAHAIDNAQPLVVEAGTGTGKTYAYLAPALRAKKKVIISTGSKALQDQLYSRDLPTVAKR
jgi:ATP-dependent DNA helicase DinG